LIQRKMKGFDFFNTWRGFEKPKTPKTITYDISRSLSKL